VTIARLTLVYDGECDFCRRLASWVERPDRCGTLLVAPNQQTGLIERLGLTQDEVSRASWAIEPGGRRFEGAAGISRVLRELVAGWRVLGGLYLIPPVGWLGDRYYSRVARRRGWW
jgi:predicted DCC family thiol-disulfide oxidoreductase YuxK